LSLEKHFWQSGRWQFTFRIRIEHRKLRTHGVDGRHPFVLCSPECQNKAQKIENPLERYQSWLVHSSLFVRFDLIKEVLGIRVSYTSHLNTYKFLPNVDLILLLTSGGAKYQMAGA
jgi:hypothetical protein